MTTFSNYEGHVILINCSNLKLKFASKCQTSPQWCHLMSQEYLQMLCSENQGMILIVKERKTLHILWHGTWHMYSCKNKASDFVRMTWKSAKQTTTEHKTQYDAFYFVLSFSHLSMSWVETSSPNFTLCYDAMTDPKLKWTHRKSY